MSAPQNFRSAMHGFNREDVVRYLEYLNAKHTAQVNQMTSDAEALQQKLTQLQNQLDSREVSADCSQELKQLQEKLEKAEETSAQWEHKCDELQKDLEELADQPSSEAFEALRKERDQALAEKQELQEHCRQLEEQDSADPEELRRLQEKLDRAEAENNALKAQLEDQKLLPAGADPEELRRVHAMLDSSAAENASLKAQLADLRQQLNAAPRQPASPSMAEQELEAYRRAERAERVATQRANQIYQQVNLVLNNATGKIDGISAELCDAAERFNAQLAQMQAAVSAGKIAVGEAVKTMYALRPEPETEN